MTALLVIFAELSEGLGRSGVVLLGKGGNSSYLLPDAAEKQGFCLLVVVCYVDFVL